MGRRGSAGLDTPCGQPDPRAAAVVWLRMLRKHELSAGLVWVPRALEQYRRLPVEREDGVFVYWVISSPGSRYVYETLCKI